MNILFIGGTGNISSACAARAIAQGHSVAFLNRGNHPDLTPAAVETIKADIRDRAAAEKALGRRRFDVVVDWVAFVVPHVETDYALFRGRTDQYLFISSASAYRKPPNHWVITEATDLFNPYWQYSRDKIACEAWLMERHRKDGFPVTIVRPSHTYSDGWFPTSFGSTGFTVAARMLAGEPVVVHGDGTSLWTITHVEDFSRAFTDLLGNPLARGELFHITSEQALSWDHIHGTIGGALGVEPKIIHVPSDFIAGVSAERGAELLGDKAYSVVFDNSKIKRFAPNYANLVPFHAGMRRSVAWYEKHPQLKVRDPKVDAEIELVLREWNK
jgi:nucleoside-diphosphate-sugar epimerase